MVSENVYKILEPGTLIRVKENIGVIVEVNFEFSKVSESDIDPCLYTALVDGSKVLLIREAFEIVEN